MPSKEAAIVKVDIDIVKEFEIDESRAAQIEAIFAPMVKGLRGFEGQYNALMKVAAKGITPEVVAQAKRLRIDIGKVRIEAEKARKKEKDQYLRGGRAVDGVNNILKFAISDKEEKLREVEEHFERIEQQKREKIAESRREELDKYDFDHTHTDLVNMEEDVFERFLFGIKTAWEYEQAAKKAAEEERIAKEKADEEERIRIREENERLNRENELMRKLLAELRSVSWDGSEACDSETEELVIKYEDLVSMSEADFIKLAKRHNALVAKETGRRIDLERIWANQKLSDAMEEQLLDIAEEVNEEIQDTPDGITNVTEWCKRAMCWEKIQNLSINLSEDLRKELIYADKAREEEHNAELVQRIQSGIEIQAYVIKKGAKHWARLLEWATENKAFNSQQMSIVESACFIPKRLPSEKQAIVIKKLEEQAIQDGFFPNMH